jgi:hypothetical protein
MTQAGVYITHHRWLDIDYGPGNLYKVGHTGNLSARLNDSAYVTCFSEPWRYVATFELPSKEDAFLLETAVLHCCRHYRLGTRELVRMTAPDIIRLAEKAARRLGLRPVRRPARQPDIRAGSPGEATRRRSGAERSGRRTPATSRAN